MNETIKLIGQIFGIVATIESLFLFTSLKRERMVLAKLFGDILWAVNYICLSMYTGAFLNIIAIFRECVFYQRGKSKFWDSRNWLYIFLGITLATAPLTWTGPLSIIPAVGSACAVVGYYNKTPMFTRIMGFIAQLFWIVYTVIGRNWPAVISASFQSVSALIGIYRELRERKKIKAK